MSREKKFYNHKGITIKTISKDSWSMKEGQRMLIATPEVIDWYIRTIPRWEFREIKQMREDLAKKFEVDIVCPMTTAMFTRIVAERAYEQYTTNTPIDEICPFWRVIKADSALGEKCTFGTKFISDNQNI